MDAKTLEYMDKRVKEAKQIENSIGYRKRRLEHLAAGGRSISIGGDRIAEEGTHLYKALEVAIKDCIEADIARLEARFDEI